MASITHTPKSGSKLTGTEYEATDAHIVALVDADIPASIARDAEVTSAIAALSTVYQPLDADLTAIAALTTTTFGRSLLALADAAAGRTALGLGSAATADTDDFDAAGAADAAQAAAEAASQPLDSDLTAIAALSTTAFGRALLELADASALLSAAGAEASGTAASAVATHAADTTDVHGIADTADLVLTDDARLSDARTPTAHHTSHEDGGTDELSIAGLAGTSTALQAHLDDTADAHDASAISLDPTGLDNTDATDVQGAVADLDAAISDAGDVTNPMTAQDDLIVGGASGTPDRLAKGSDSQVLTVDPTTHHLVWATPASGFSDPTTTKGDLIVHGTSTTRLGVGTDGQVLTAASAESAGVKWADASGGSGTPATNAAALVAAYSLFR